MARVNRSEPFRRLTIAASKQQLALIALLGACLALGAGGLARAGPALNGAEPPIPGGEPEGADGRADEHQSFSLIDWNSYKRLFNKNYSSLAQQLVRQKIFMSKTIQVFLVSAKWRLREHGYFTAINQFSDLTPEEERRTLSGDGGEYASDDEDEDDDMMDDEQAQRALLAALQEDKEEGASLDSGVRQARDYGARKRDKRSLMADLKRTLTFSDLVRVPSSTKSSDPAAEERLRIKWVVPSSNPHYQPVDAISFGAEDESAQRKVEDIPEEQMGEIEMESSPWLLLPVGKLANTIGGALSKSLDWIKPPSSDGLASGSSTPKHAAAAAAATKSSAAKKSPAQGDADRTIVDWRRTGCVAPPIDQRECHSCYAVSSMAFLEWAFCMNQERVLTPLSVQYMVSCGPQFKRESDPALKIQFYGCNRGRSRQAMYFIKEYGVELAAHMPYLARDTECPIEPGAPLKSKGYIRPNVKQHVRMSAATNQLELALKVGPVIVNFREPADFLAYGGGMVGRCYQRGGHAMLIVGHGVENNTPYLLIKNSFGTTWGMKGYFKFDRKYTAECIKDFILPRVSFPSKKAQARRVKAYLAEQQAPVSSTFDLDENFDVGAGGLFSRRK